MNRYRFTMGTKVLYTYGRTLLAARGVIGPDTSSCEGDLAPKGRKR